MIDQMIDHIIALNVVTLETAFRVIGALTIIVGIETGIIGGLASRAGSLRKLFRITAVADNNAHNTSNGKGNTHKNPNKQKHF